MGQIELENLSLDLQNKINSGGNITLPISANDISEVPEKVFVTPSEKAMINANSSENASQTARIATIENTLGTLSTTDEKVAMDALSQAFYLSELVDDVTIKNIGGKLTVEALRGLLSSVVELNFLQGVSSNIQQQINNLSGVSSFRGVFTSLADLQMAPNPQDGQYAIVSSAGSSSYYFYYGGMWEFSHDTTGTTDIDINSGTIGILDKTRYVHQNATETSFNDPTGQINASNSNAAIVEVFRFADSLLKGLTQTVGSPLSGTDNIDVNLRNFRSWYANVAEAITLKGVNASPSNNGDEIIQKIQAIPNISIQGVIKKKSKMNVPLGGTIEIKLSSAIPLTDVTSTLIEFVSGSSGVVVYNLEFNNGDSSNFETNSYIEFDGVAKLKKDYIYQTTDVNLWGEGSLGVVDFSDKSFKNISAITAF